MSSVRLLGGVVGAFLACVLVGGVLGHLRGADVGSAAMATVPTALVLSALIGVVTWLQQRRRG